MGIRLARRRLVQSLQAGLLGLLLMGSLLPLGAAEKSGGLPPLEVEEDEPLRLDAPAPSAPDATPQRAGANNTPCFVCHDNYKAEPLVLRHASEGIGCVDCHGPSHAHQNDENNVTPPDRMFAAPAIDPACEACHSSHIAAAALVLARWRERSPQKTNPAAVVCTDCHGNHRLGKRMVRWDKQTGQLLR